MIAVLDHPDRAARTERSEQIRVRGVVQGVGFRPTVWRLAQRHGLRGWVANDAEGVLIHACGEAGALEAFARALDGEAPPLARVETIERHAAEMLPRDAAFEIVASPRTRQGVRTGVLPDAATCDECRRETFDPFARRYRYPFTNCTHCGPRLSIVEAIPYDRATTTMRAFAMCGACADEYRNPANRRFHAQPIACHACGPRAWLERSDRAPIATDALTTLDDVDAVATLLMRGAVVAIKGLGGFQLACDATDEAAVSRLRARKRRERKPFALMARDLDIVRRHAFVSDEEAALLASAAAPIVVLDARADAASAPGNDPSGDPSGAPGVAPRDAARLAPRVAPSVAPGLATLGFMLPNTPLHHLMLERMARPIVLTSGNLSDEPQCIENDDARARLGGIAEYFLFHNRGIARRVDDSVQRMAAGGPPTDPTVRTIPSMCTLRAGRGLAPATIALPRGFERAPPLLALGGELKNTFALLREGQAIVSHHIGDLEDAATFADWQLSTDAYASLFAFRPEALAIDRHPEYLSAKLGRERAERESLRLVEVQHHHAHIASTMAEHGLPLDSAPVLGIALDGLGYGEGGGDDDRGNRGENGENGGGGELWGGEFMAADYRGFTRLATFKPVALLGGALAMHEPWRNTYAHLMAEMGWPRFAMNFDTLELFRFLEARPRLLLDGMIAARVNSPLATSCGRLFDAAAAAAGICRERALYEGQAAVEFEAIADRRTLFDESDELAYPFAIPRLKSSGLLYVEPLAMWQALLGDLIFDTPAPVISARFHKGLAITLVQMVDKLVRRREDESVREGREGLPPFAAIVLSGGVFANRVLLEQVRSRLALQPLPVLVPQRLPCGDGGLSLGQATIAAARLIDKRDQENAACA